MQKNLNLYKIILESNHCQANMEHSGGEKLCGDRNKFYESLIL